MSELRVDSVKSKGGGAPDLPKGVTISGITTAVTLGATQIDVSNVNVSGVVTSGTLSGSLLSTGTPTLGLGVTINSSGLHISGVATAGIVSATTLYGDGTNITGVGATIAPLFYNPDLSDSLVLVGTGIGITFNQQIKAGTGNITIRETNASGTVVENFGVGSSVTISENRVTFSPTSDLSENTIYHVSYPSGCFTNNEGTDYVGTAYTFKTQAYNYELWMWGKNNNGQLGQNSTTTLSSPVQIPGTTWRYVCPDLNSTMAIKTDGTLWSWGYNDYGSMGVGQPSSYKVSSPVQVGSGTNWKPETLLVTYDGGMCCKTDGTLWSWGYGTHGRLGNNQDNPAPAPVQLPGTNWDKTLRTALRSAGAIKTDGTLWVWGQNSNGALGLNNATSYSSPVQIPGTTWAHSNSGSYYNFYVTKTDGTMWTWGSARYGLLANNDWQGPHGDGGSRSSPIQIPGTNWSTAHGSLSGGSKSAAAIKADGTLWAWGYSKDGHLGQNQGPGTNRSSPAQIGSDTTWASVRSLAYANMMIKTDGTLWALGSGDEGGTGLNTNTHRSSPVQVGSDTTWFTDGWTTGPFNMYHCGAVKKYAP